MSPMEKMPGSDQPNAEKGVLKGTVFEEIKDKQGRVVGYKSSSRERKKVVLSPDSPIPLPGIPYEVRIIGDTNPDDPMSGEYSVVLISGQKSQLSAAEWQQVEREVGAAEDATRLAQQASAALYRETGVPKEERIQNKADSVEGRRSGRSRLIRSMQGQEELSTAEATQILGDEDSPHHELVDLRRTNLVTALREDHQLEAEKEELLDEEVEVLKSVKESGDAFSHSALREIDTEMRGLDAKRDELLQSTPEAYYGLHLKQLKEYKESLDEKRLVETPYVRERAEDIHAHIRGGKPVLIYGHLGSGKTELAMQVARDYIGKEALVISGSKTMSLAELYGHQVLQLDAVSTDALTKAANEVEAVFKKWEEQHKESTEEEKNRVHDTVLQTYLTKLQKGTVTDFFLGPVYRAMDEGRPLIIDEVNAIPHEILISLNHILTRKVGDEVLVQQDSGKTITIKEGFGILMTGNLNQGQEVYVDRQDMDPAFLSRLYKIEYDYLPQETEGDLAHDAGPQNELFQVMLAKVMDRHGNLQIPKDSLNSLWNLAKAARVTQDVFAGREVDSAFFFQMAGAPRGVQYFLKESVLSLRALDAVLSQWQNDGYKNELDYYIWNEFIAQSTQPSDRAYLYQLLQNRFGFFQGEWPQNPSTGSGGDIRSFTIQPPRNRAEEIEFHGPRELVDKAFGRGPKRTAWPGQTTAPKP